MLELPQHKLEHRPTAMHHMCKPTHQIGRTQSGRCMANATGRRHLHRQPHQSSPESIHRTLHSPRTSMERQTHAVLEPQTMRERSKPSQNPGVLQTRKPNGAHPLHQSARSMVERSHIPCTHDRRTQLSRRRISNEGSDL